MRGEDPPRRDFAVDHMDEFVDGVGAQVSQLAAVEPAGPRPRQGDGAGDVRRADLFTHKDVEVV